MNSKIKLSISQFAILGMCLILAGGCKNDNNDPDNLAMIIVEIPAGTFTMGSPSGEVNRLTSETQHQVTLSAFEMSKYEITNAQYADFLNSKGIGSDGLYAAGVNPGEVLIYESSGSYDWGLHYSSGQWFAYPDYETHPVINVTWYGATLYAYYKGGRLPTEAEWEYACRATTTTPFNTGNCLTNENANYNWEAPYSTCTNTHTSIPYSTQAVGTYGANGYGLHDMHGNVCEWCSDWGGDYPTTAQTNPTGPTTGWYRVVRGGSWYDYARNCRSADRYYVIPIGYGLGFRVVFDPH